MLLTVASSRLKKQRHTVVLSGLYNEPSIVTMPRDDNVGMVNLLGLGGRYLFGVKYFREDSLAMTKMADLSTASSQYCLGISLLKRHLIRYYALHREEAGRGRA